MAEMYEFIVRGFPKDPEKMEQVEDWAAQFLKESLEKEVMETTGYGVLLFDKHIYETRECEGNIQDIAISIAYRRLSEEKVGITWGFKLTEKEDQRHFKFRVRKEYNYDEEDYRKESIRFFVQERERLLK